MARKRQTPDNIKEETKILPKEPDDKDRAVELLKSKGYDSWLEFGVVYTAYVTENTFKEVTQILEEVEYKYSYGVKVRNYERESRRQETEGVEG